MKPLEITKIACSALPRAEAKRFDAPRLFGDFWDAKNATINSGGLNLAAFLRITILGIITLLIIGCASPSQPEAPSLPEFPSAPAQDAVISPPPAPTQPSQVEKQVTESYTLEADDKGFYKDGKEIYAMNVSKGKNIELTFAVRTTDVYYSGLDFRSKNFNTDSVPPGSSTTVTFTASSDFTITSFWPSTSRSKAEFTVLVG